MYRKCKGTPIFVNKVKRSYLNIVTKKHNKKHTKCKGKTQKYICQLLPIHKYIIIKQIKKAHQMADHVKAKHINTFANICKEYSFVSKIRFNV